MTLNSKVNTIADIELGMLLTEKEFLEQKLEMTERAISCAQFLEKYFKIVQNRDVEITVTAKEIDLSTKP